MIRTACLSIVAGILVHCGSPRVSAQLDYEQDPIHYSTATATDPVARLADRIRAGEAKLTWDAKHGYLPAMMKELNVPLSSQVLVFSKTSLQISRITPRTPRAIYFNDDVYLGWVQHGEVVEISAADPVLGGTFYTLAQKETEQPEIKRETAHCLQCHGSTHTRRTPGHMVRSVYSDAGGLPVYRLGTHLNDDTSPFEERWGGWYVTGTHGRQRHMGNTILPKDSESEELDYESGANRKTLEGLVNTTPYQSAHSDIVALMVLQHQTTMHNILTAANHSGQLTARDSEIMNKALERPEDFESESTARRYASAAEKVVQGLLFCGEYRLTDPIAGTSGFSEEFAARGPFDSQGRSLRQFDLQTRLFRYPCSFLIHTDSFKSLPPGVLKIVWRRLDEILSGQDESPKFAHLSSDDRRAIREILLETVEGTPWSISQAVLSNR
ncbi:MAG: hypothetical protein JNL58_02805 [Planctomyces sp.]|nr:hypothetical protein [Planctomyces sp.]